jgi:thioesterase domain-containing protein
LFKQVDVCQNVGPYIFAGHSLGGLTSLQLAIAKSMNGHASDVWMFDSVHPAQMPPFGEDPIDDRDVMDA